MKSIEHIQNDIYSAYFKLGEDAFHDRIRYFEDHKSEIDQLGFDPWINLNIDYILALFKVEAYYTFLNQVDRLIETVIDENIFEHKGRDVYKDLLLKKAIASLAVVDYHKADDLLKQLVRMAPENDIIKKSFIRSAVEKARYENQMSRSLTIGLFFASALIIAFEILYVRSFKPEWVQYFEWTRNSAFVIGVLNILFQEIRIRVLAISGYKKIKNSVIHQPPQI